MGGLPPQGSSRSALASENRERLEDRSQIIRRGRGMLDQPVDMRDSIAKTATLNGLARPN